MKGVLRIMSRFGDTAVAWDTEQIETVSEANLQFEKLIQCGYLAYQAGRVHTQITVFDPQAAEVVMVPPMVGG